jgi:hypothetical protein
VPPETTVYVIVRVGNLERYLARSRPADDGTFDVEVVPGDAAEPWHVEVGAWAPGRPRVEETYGVAAGTTVEATLRFPGGPRLVGTVVDERGAPLGGVGFVLLQHAHPATFHTVPTPDPAADAAKGSWDDSVVAFARTRESGTFEVEGLAREPHYPLSADEGWWLEADGGRSLEPGETPVRIVARPAFLLELDVVPADPADDPIARWPHVFASVTVGDGSWSRSAAAGSRLVLRGPIPADGRRGLVAAVRADTWRHVPETRDVALSPGAWTRRERVALRRLPATVFGTLVLESDLRDFAGRRVPLGLVVRRATGPRSTIGDWIALANAPDGTHTGEVRSGTQTVVVNAQTRLHDLLVWKGEIEVAAAGSTRFRVPWPPNGRVRLRLPTGDPPSSHGSLSLTVLAEGRRHAGAWSGAAVDGAIEIPGVPAGEAQASWSGRDGVRKASFTVTAGGEVTVELLP